MARRRISTQALTGGIIVVIGVLLLLSTTGLYDVGAVWRYVPSLFVLLGVWALYRGQLRNVTGPVVLIVIAGAVQLVTLGVITGAEIAAWWPLLIVLFGVSLLVGHWRRSRRVPATTTDDFDLIGVFGESEQRISSGSFRGGSATAIFGGIDVDLRDAAVDEPPAVVSVTALFGGVELAVPEEWVVQIEALPVFGAVEDERRRRPASAERRDGPDLVVTGFVAFGGISIT